MNDTPEPPIPAKVSTPVWPPPVKAGTGYRMTQNQRTRRYELFFEDVKFEEVRGRDLGLMIIWARIKDGYVSQKPPVVSSPSPKPAAAPAG